MVLIFYFILIIVLVIYLLAEIIVRLIRIENKIDNLPQITEKGEVR